MNEKSVIDGVSQKTSDGPPQPLQPGLNYQQGGFSVSALGEPMSMALCPSPFYMETTQALTDDLPDHSLTARHLCVRGPNHSTVVTLCIYTYYSVGAEIGERFRRTV